MFKTAKQVTAVWRMEGMDLTSQRLFHDEIHGDGFLSPCLPYPRSVTFTCGWRVEVGPEGEKNVTLTEIDSRVYQQEAFNIDFSPLSIVLPPD